MFNFIAVMFIGLFVGWLLRARPLSLKLTKPIFYTILLLLFAMGLNIGGNENLLRSLSGLGLYAILISFCCTLGSILAAAFIWKFFFKEAKVK